MSTTLTGPTLNRDRLSCKLIAFADSASYWDDSNKRWKSGRLSTVINSFSWTGTKQDGEFAEVTVRPVNFNAACHPQYFENPEVDASRFAFSGYTNVAVINYGYPSPSARLEQDGTISLVEVEIALPVGTLSSIVPSIKYDQTFTEYSPYSNFVGGSNKDIALELLSDNESAWASINREKLASDKYGLIGVQLKGLDSTVAPGFPASDAPIMFSVANAPQLGGPAITLIQHALPRSVNRSKTLSKFFTYYFAVNAGLIDANATPVVDPDNAKTLYNLCNVGLTKPAMSGDYATAALDYDVVHYLLS